MSPFLYILMVESLSRKFSGEMVAGSTPGIKVARGVDSTNHALFAHDSLILGGSSVIIARAFNGVLQNFCQSSGALMNKGKSVVFGWNVDQQTMQRIAFTLGFPGFEKWDKINYLGLPLTLGPWPK